MVEVELKFNLTAEEQKRLVEGAAFIKQEEFTDVYYEKNDYSLSTNDVWVRSRNDKFMLKVPVSSTSALLQSQKNSPKHEIENVEEISKYFNIPATNDQLQDALIKQGIIPMYRFRNIRKTFKKGEFIIDFDEAIFEDFTYETCEIELSVETEAEADMAIQKIEDFSRQHNIEVKYVEGRLIEYIRRKNPEHYKLLEEAR